MPEQKKIEKLTNKNENRNIGQRKIQQYSETANDRIDKRLKLQKIIQSKYYKIEEFESNRFLSRYTLYLYSFKMTYLAVSNQNLLL